MFIYLHKILAFTVVIIFCFVSVHAKIFEDFSNHPCKRTCVENRTMVCNYQLTIDKYFSMQPDCLNCTKGSEKDCNNKNCIVAHGGSRLVTAYNAMLPGPTIEVCKGDKIVVDIHNNLDLETTTIHWHGMHHRKSQNMDGVPMITQDPILPGSLFRYEFEASQDGTTFYHSHSHMQRTNGAYGHLIIKKPNSQNNHVKLYDHDLIEHVISLTDWFEEPTEVHLLRYLRNKEFYDGKIITILINGYGSINYVPPKIFHVKPNQKYRFRLIHAGAAACPFEFQIKNHKLLFINTDGFDIKPVEADRIILKNGERYDFVLESNQKNGTYQILVTGSLKCEGLISTALLKYGNSTNLYKFKNTDLKSASKELVFNCVSGTYTNCSNYKDLKSVSKVDSVLTTNPDFKYFLSVDIREYALKKYRGVLDSEVNTPFINKISSTMPKNTLIKHGSNNESFCNTDKFCEENLCECFHLVKIPFNSLVELIIVNEGEDTTHPMHLHGYSFIVVGQGKIGEAGSMDVVKNLDKMKKLPRNFEFPILKDTVAVPEESYIIIRFLADNPGFWSFHCHVDLHMSNGMHMIFQVGDHKIP